jgi:hypothetical protein
MKMELISSSETSVYLLYNVISKKLTLNKLAISEMSINVYQNMPPRFPENTGIYSYRWEDVSSSSAHVWYRRRTCRTGGGWKESLTDLEAVFMERNKDFREDSATWRFNLPLEQWNAESGATYARTFQMGAISFTCKQIISVSQQSSQYLLTIK